MPLSRPEILAQLLAPFGERTIPALALVQSAGAEVAAELFDNHSLAHAVTCEPGDGFSYSVVFTRLGNLNAPMGLRSRGDLLVSLPDFHVCLLLNSLSMATLHMPSYVAEKVGAGAPPRAVAFVAALATEVSGAYADMAAQLEHDENRADAQSL